MGRRKHRKQTNDEVSAVILKGEESRRGHFGGILGEGQHQDAGAKIHHLASNTTSKILSKSISKNGGRGTYRGMVTVSPKADNCKLNVVCDALILMKEVGPTRTQQWRWRIQALDASRSQCFKGQR